MIQTSIHLPGPKLARASALALTLALAASGCKDSKPTDEATPATPVPPLSYRVLVLDPIPFDDPETTPEGEPNRACSNRSRSP
jgi:hypothetical protein